MVDRETIDKFVAEERLRLAQERQTLEKNPTSAISDYNLDEGQPKQHPLTGPRIKQIGMSQTEQLSVKENLLKTKPPTPQLLKLGEAYKHHKEKLKEELRQEYRQALAEKQIRTTGVRGRMETSYERGLATSQKDDLGLSLPIRDHLSAKERLRQERNQEYNQFKANKENEEKMKFPQKMKTFATPITDFTPDTDQSEQPPPTKSRIEESYQELLERKRQEERAYRHSEVPEDALRHRERNSHKFEDGGLNPSRRVGFAKKRRPQYVEYYYDDDEEAEEELIERLRARRRRRARLRHDDEDEEDLFVDVRPKKEFRPLERRRSAEGKTRVEALNQASDLRSKSAPPEQEFTGLPIGTVPSANTVHRRKEEYKLELTKQMEEDRQRKLREKQLDRQAEASKQPTVTVLRAEKNQERPPDGDEDEKISKKKKGKRKLRKLDSSDSDSGSDRKHWTARGGYPPFYAPSMPTGYYPPPPMSYPSLYDEAYRYYGSQHPLNPAQLLDPSYGNIPPHAPTFSDEPKLSGTQKGGKRSQLPGESLRQSQTLRGGATKSSLISDETRDSIKKKEMMQTYQEELREQMRIKEKKKEEAKREQEQYDKKKEAEAADYNPWGKGGGGAPMKDTHGNLISDLRSMHIQNEELVRDPTKVVELAKQRQKVLENTEEIFHTPRKQGTDLFVMSPRFGRSNPFEEKLTAEQRTLKDTYKDELRKQIEEKRRVDAERKEQLRIMEEKEEQRMLEDNRKMKEELEKEKQKERDKIEEQKRKNEEIQKALAENRKEEEQKRKDEQRKREEEERREKERELDEKFKKQGYTPRARTQERSTPRHSATPQETAPKQAHFAPAHQEVAVQASQTVPVSYNPSPTPARSEQSRDSKRISRELSALRKQLVNEQQRIEEQLRVGDRADYASYLPSRKQEAVVDLSRRQRPVHVRRPPTVERPNSKALREFTDFKHKQDDTTSLRMFRIQHPDTPIDPESLEKQQEDLIKSQMMRIEALRSRQMSKSGLSSTEQNNRLKTMRDGYMLPAESRASLLEAETDFIPVPEEDLENLPPSRSKKASARERRRNRRNEEGSLTYRASPERYSAQSLNSLATLDIDRMASKNQLRLDRLKSLQGDEVSLNDPDDILDRFVNQQKGGDFPETPSISSLDARRPRKGTSVSAPQQERPPSVNTVDTEPWLRPGTGPPATAT